MKPRLAIGLGNLLMGDDGVGCVVAARLASDPRLPGDVEVVCGGTDLLRYSREIEGRSRVLVIDALQDDGEPGSILYLDENSGRLDERQENAHALSAVQAIRLLRLTTPVDIRLLGISIGAARAGAELSRALAARVPMMVDQVLRLLEAVGDQPAGV